MKIVHTSSSSFALEVIPDGLRLVVFSKLMNCFLPCEGKAFAFCRKFTWEIRWIGCEGKCALSNSWARSSKMLPSMVETAPSGGSALFSLGNICHFDFGSFSEGKGSG